MHRGMSGDVYAVLHCRTEEEHISIPQHKRMCVRVQVCVCGVRTSVRWHERARVTACVRVCDIVRLCVMWGFKPLPCIHCMHGQDL